MVSHGLGEWVRGGRVVGVPWAGRVSERVASHGRGLGGWCGMGWEVKEGSKSQEAARQAVCHKQGGWVEGWQVVGGVWVGGVTWVGRAGRRVASCGGG